MKISQKQQAAASAPGCNLLKNRFIGGFIKSKWYPGIFKWPTVFSFVLIMYILLFGPTIAHNNLGTALTWVLWWPLIPIIFVLVGRFWCAICPFGTLNDVVQKFVGHKRPVPIFLRKYGIWIIDAIFILITWGDHVFGMVESPWVSGVVMLMITTAVVASGALWECRTFCRYLCFLGGLSGNYSQTGMLALRSKPEKCAQCKDPVCYKGAKTVPGCRMFEYPRVMDSSANCNLCGDCVKSCPHDSLTLTGRLPSQELWSVHKPKLAAAFLAVVIMGIVFLQNITMLEMWQGILSWLENLLHTKNYFVTFTVTFLVILPIPIYLLTFVSFVAKKINGDTLAQNFTRFGYAIIALDVAGHIAHNLFHLLAEGKSVYITALMFAGREAHGISPALLSSPTIQLLQYGLIILGVIGSLYTAYRISRSNYPDKTWGSLAPCAILIVVLGVINIVLFSLPMSMRM